MKFITNYKELEGGNEDKSLLDHCNVDPINNKDNLLSYLSNNEYLEGIRTSHIYDYVSGSRTTITNKTYCDGEYFWTEEEKYHFDKYNLELEADFIKKVSGSQK